MRRERWPPGIATWLLKGLGCSADNDAVIGDLTEEFLRGRTSVWYWKQTAVAILAFCYCHWRCCSGRTPEADFSLDGIRLASLFVPSLRGMAFYFSRRR